jgi:hypothetical protein
MKVRLRRRACLAPRALTRPCGFDGAQTPHSQPKKSKRREGAEEAVPDAVTPAAASAKKRKAKADCAEAAAAADDAVEAEAAHEPSEAPEGSGAKKRQARGAAVAEAATEAGEGAATDGAPAAKRRRKSRPRHRAKPGVELTPQMVNQLLAREKRGEIKAANAFQKQRLAAAHELRQKQARKSAKSWQRSRAA